LLFHARQFPPTASTYFRHCKTPCIVFPKYTTDASNCQIKSCSPCPETPTPIARALCSKYYTCGSARPRTAIVANTLRAIAIQAFAGLVHYHNLFVFRHYLTFLINRIDQRIATKHTRIASFVSSMVSMFSPIDYHSRSDKIHRHAYPNNPPTYTVIVPIIVNMLCNIPQLPRVKRKPIQQCPERVCLFGHVLCALL
jgi:hypothetical protein